MLFSAPDQFVLTSGNVFSVSVYYKGNKAAKKEKNGRII